MTKIELFHHGDNITSYKAGEVIFHSGDEGEHIYDIVEGEVDLLFQGNLVNTLTKGDIFGEMGLISGEAHSVTAQARTDCKAAKIDKNRFLFLVEETPNFALHIMRILAERLRKETLQHY